MGTPAYMSPEQAQGHPLDHRSDLYSLGATYYFMLAGTPPFKADSPVAMALKQVREIPSSLLIHRPDLPVEIDRLVMKLMAKNPADRYQSAAEMLGDLARIRGTIQLPASGTEAIETIPARAEASVAASPAAPAPVPTEPKAHVEAPRVRKPRREAGRRRGQRGQRQALSPAPPAIQRSGRLGRDGGRPGGRRLAGWAARAPDVASLPDDLSRAPPPSGSSPDGARSPRRAAQSSRSNTARYIAPSDQAAAAWLAVPGYYAPPRCGLPGLCPARPALVSPG